jgi:hypothetical protein
MCVDSHAEQVYAGYMNTVTQSQGLALLRLMQAGLFANPASYLVALNSSAASIVAGLKEETVGTTGLWFCPSAGPADRACWWSMCLQTWPTTPCRRHQNLQTEEGVSPAKLMCSITWHNVHQSGTCQGWKHVKPGMCMRKSKPRLTLVDGCHRVCFIAHSNPAANMWWADDHSTSASL